MFEGPRLKIKRANQHIGELNESLNAFVKTDFCRISLENNGGKYIVKMDTTKPLPCEWPLIIGDAIHNLRSALDIAQCELVSLAGGAPTDWTRFMFAENRNELIDKLGKGVLKGAPDVVVMIADVIKPYTTRDNPLAAMHSLDIADKHTLLLPVIGITQLRGMDATIAGFGKLTNNTFSVSHGAIMFPVISDAPIQITRQGEPSFGITFGEGQPLEGQAIIPTFHQLSQLVSNVIDTFEDTIRARQRIVGSLKR
jgi:hypothetical protein